MPYNFDELIDRRGRPGSHKWNFYPEDVIPMWIADMDFRAPNVVLNALREKVEHGILGYEQASDELIQVVCERMQRLYNWRVTPQQIIVVPGLVTGINAVARALCQPGDGVLMHTPVYSPFLEVPKNQNLVKQTTPFICISDGRTLHYEIDFDAFEAAISDYTRLYLLCHPHNPIGKTFSRAELTRLGEICLRHNAIICSDEIHAELLLDDNPHTPLAAVSPEIAARTVTLIAASKTFNTAGLFCSFIIVPDADIRQKIIAATEGTVPWVNAMGLAAALAAFRDDPDTNEWHTSLLQYLKANRDTLVDYVTTRLPDIKTTVPQATYLAWLDCRDAKLGDPFEFFMQKAKVALSDGIAFGPGGEGFVRLNFGCPRSRLLEALDRMKAALSQ